MCRLIEAHLEAEAIGDAAGCVAVYTEDAEHDVVGAPHGPLRGRDEARRFYERLFREITLDELIPIRSYFGEDFCVMEHEWVATLMGPFLGLVGSGRQVSLRVLHVWEFRDGSISRCNAWMDWMGVDGIFRQADNDSVSSGGSR